MRVVNLVNHQMAIFPGAGGKERTFFVAVSGLPQSAIHKNVTAWGRMLRRDVTAWTAIIINVSGHCYVVTACRAKGAIQEFARVPLGFGHWTADRLDPFGTAWGPPSLLQGDSAQK